MFRILSRARKDPLGIATLTSRCKNGTAVGFRSFSQSPAGRTRIQSLANTSPVFIPENHQSRTLVLCFDGTGGEFDENVRALAFTSGLTTLNLYIYMQDSNVLAFFSMLKKNDRSRQLCYYQAGLGSYASSLINTSNVSRISTV
jgi:hypothetical protein